MFFLPLLSPLELAQLHLDQDNSQLETGSPQRQKATLFFPLVLWDLNWTSLCKQRHAFLSAPMFGRSLMSWFGNRGGHCNSGRLHRLPSSAPLGTKSTRFLRQRCLFAPLQMRMGMRPLSFPRLANAVDQKTGAPSLLFCARLARAVAGLGATQCFRASVSDARQLAVRRARGGADWLSGPANDRWDVFSGPNQRLPCEAAAGARGANPLGIRFSHLGRLIANACTCVELRLSCFRHH
jgi:hypothetical protein